MDVNKECPICGNAIKGRSDKKYCSLKCKSINQYEKRQTEEAFFLMVERQLKINRRILKKHNRSGFSTLRKSELTAQGFDPKYHTHFWENRKGDRYLFVYEYGFLEKTVNGKQKILLVIWQEYMAKKPK